MDEIQKNSKKIKEAAEFRLPSGWKTVYGKFFYYKNYLKFYFICITLNLLKNNFFINILI